eukprot:354987-Chlamydomonas_euryale.AAC.2
MHEGIHGSSKPTGTGYRTRPASLCREGAEGDRGEWRRVSHRQAQSARRRVSHRQVQRARHRVAVDGMKPCQRSTALALPAATRRMPGSAHRGKSIFFESRYSFRLFSMTLNALLQA